jgi:SnoaL-like domain
MPLEALGNIGYVRRLWDAFRSGGVAAMAELVPPDVTWRPGQADGRCLQGTEDLAAFWASREVEVPSVRMFHGDRDDVLVEAEYRRDGASSTTVWLLYRFQGERLVEAISFPSEEQARSYYRPALPADDH